MLTLHPTPNYVEFELHTKSSSYNEPLNKQYLETYITAIDQPIVKLLNKCIENIKSITDHGTEEILNFVCSQNPLALFSECYAHNCPLNRNTNGLYRMFFEKKLVNNIIKHNRSGKLKYTSCYPGYFFQDIIILTQLREHFSEITVNFVGEYNEYCTMVQDPQFNPNAPTSALSYEFTDEKADRCMWIRFMTYRIIKMLEWLNTTTCKFNLRFYKSTDSLISECEQNNEAKCDVFVGTDYVDQFPTTIFDFMIVSQCATKNVGLIASLRTDGLPFSSNDINHHIEIKYNLHCNQNIITKKKFTDKLNELAIDLSKHVTEIEETGKNPFEGIYDESIVGEDGVTYKWHSLYCTSKDQKWIRKYVDDKYSDINKEINKVNEEYYLAFKSKFDDLEKIYDLHGTYKSLLWMIFYLIFYND